MPNAISSSFAPLPSKRLNDFFFFYQSVFAVSRQISPKKILEVHVCSSFDEGAEERGGSVGADVMGWSFVVVVIVLAVAVAAAVVELS